ncbi:hypothetical protein B1748_29930 [Paenibacillus sp. MY03]|uniref:glycosyltransferase n=1 Tax=Paenibacillus TaxID=44249 RepID=UPI000B3CA9B3|nr:MULTISPECIES: glycosyltransferase [Paenibacillus]OUS69954.1 hypothetical protein B1748_29930 [Paenibacillus sp. MY03]
MINSLSVRKLHIVIYSELKEYGGGRETWLNYFLPGLLKENIFSEIIVYGLKPILNQDTLYIKFNSLDKLKFIPINAGDVNKKNLFLNMKNYCIKTTQKIMKYASSGDTILLMSANMEAVVGIIAKFLLRKNISVITWMRSIGVKEISSRKGKGIQAISAFLEKKIFKISNRIIMNGKDTYSHYVSSYPQVSKKMKTIENAVDYTKFSGMPLPNFNESHINITYIGRFNREKGFFDFLESIDVYNGQSFARNTNEEKIKFNIWGHGCNVPEKENMDYFGVLEREELFQALNKSHVLVFLNLSNNQLAAGLSHALLEALAAGRLCIAYNNAAHNQILNKSNSILIEESDVSNLAYAYNSILKANEAENNEIIKLCQKGRDAALPFTIEAHISKFIQIINEITSE